MYNIIVNRIIMTNRTIYYSKTFINEEQLTDFLNKLEADSWSSDSYSGRCYEYAIVAVYKNPDNVILIYAITQ